MAFLNKIVPILLLPVLAGCEEVFTPDLPHTPVLCVNSLVSAGEPIEVSVSKSRLYTDSADKSEVKDAVVNIYANGKLQLDSYIPVEGDEIRIVAQSKSFGTADAEVFVPMATPIQGVKWETYDVNCWQNDYGYYNIQFRLKVFLTISDPAGENYYKFSFQNTNTDNIYEDEDNQSNSHTPYISVTDLQYDLEPIFSEHIGIFESVMGGDAYAFSFFTDRQFAGKSYTLTLQFNNCWFSGTFDEMPDCDFILTLNSISSSYYNWANYVWQRDNGALNELSDYGFGNPIWGYSNCTSGAGVVAAQSTDEYRIDLSDFIKGTITNHKNNNQ